nr:kinesin-like protein KIF3A isoform X2 [Dermatophagoides farinae]
MRVFGGIKNGLELPKINVNKQQESNNGKEVNLNLKHSNTNSTTSGGVSMKNSKPLKNSAKCTPKKSGFTMKNSDNPDNTHSQTKRNGLNFELSLTPKGKENKINGANNGEDWSQKTKSISQKQKNGANIAFNLNLAVNMDDDAIKSDSHNIATNSIKKIETNNNNPTMLSDSGILDITPNKIDQPSSIKVAVRMRPLADNEKTGSQKDGKITDVLMKDKKVMIPSKKDLFEFDYCFDSSNRDLFNYASQEIVFRKMGQPLLDYAHQGFNVCLFAYGQSGSGKTYTMLGTEENPGITPRFLNDLFKRITTTKKDIEYIVNVSFLEIYNEKINDLLSDEFEMLGKNLRVREHPQTGTYVEDLTVFTVESYENAMELLKNGLDRRSTATTNLNEKSSRSHSIFSIILVQNRRFDRHNDDDDSSDDNPRTTETSCISKINLVDLAGSERVGNLNSDRFREGTMINKSLLTLGKVISQLADNSSSRQNSTHHAHVPYRDSVLTYLLRDSLGGNSRTSMIATISPAKIHLEETISTLRYASIAQKIINIVHVNEDPKMKIINTLLKQISFLRKEVDRTRDSSPNDSYMDNNQCDSNNGTNGNDQAQNEDCNCDHGNKKLLDLKIRFKTMTKNEEEIHKETKYKNQNLLKDYSNLNKLKFEHNIDNLRSLIKTVKKEDHLKGLKTIAEFESSNKEIITEKKTTTITTELQSITKKHNKKDQKKDDQSNSSKIETEVKVDHSHSGNETGELIDEDKKQQQGDNDTFHSCDQSSENELLQLATEDSTASQDFKTLDDDSIQKDEDFEKSSSSVKKDDQIINDDVKGDINNEKTGKEKAKNSTSNLKDAKNKDSGSDADDDWQNDKKGKKGKKNKQKGAKRSSIEW